MSFPAYFPVWDKLTPAQQAAVTGSLVHRTVDKGTILHNGNADCTGVYII